MREDGGGASRSTEPAAGTSSATDVSLLEHVSQAIKYERSLGQYLTGFLLAFGAFAWSQIQRRLEILNHENARLLAQQERSVSSDTYEANEQQRKSEQTEFKAWQEKVNAYRTEGVSRNEFNAETKRERRGTIDSGLKLAAVVIAVASTLLGYFVPRALEDRPPATTPPAVVTVTVTAPTTTSP